MITELTKAVIKKHGVLVLRVDETGRLGISRKEDKENLTFWSFSLANCLIRMLALAKLEQLRGEVKS